MKKSIVTIAITATLILSACSKEMKDEFNISVSSPTTNTELSSGSAASVSDNKLVVLGDDEPWLFYVDKDKNNNIDHKILIKKYPLEDSGRINKKIKPDFEAMSKLEYKGEKYFLVMGSGSKSTRNSAYLMNLDGSGRQVFDLSSLYLTLYKASGFSGKQHINIEGVATTKNYVFIFNRGNSGTNIIFKINLSQFMKFLTGKSDTLDSLQTYFVTLPKIEGTESTFSGVDYWPQTKSLIFSASVEGESDAIKDGTVLGSFIGVLPVSKLESDTSPNKMQPLDSYMQLLKKGNQKLITKVESVAIDHSNKKSASGYLVSDNDDGTSQFMSFDVSKP